jgi:hypothetical protein
MQKMILFDVLGHQKRNRMNLFWMITRELPVVLDETLPFCSDHLLSGSSFGTSRDEGGRQEAEAHGKDDKASEVTLIYPGPRVAY